MSTFCHEGVTDYFIAPEKAELKFVTCKEGILNGEYIHRVSKLAKGDIHYPYLAILDTAGSQVLIFDKNKGFETSIRTIQNSNQFGVSCIWIICEWLNNEKTVRVCRHDLCRFSRERCSIVAPLSVFQKSFPFE